MKNVLIIFALLALATPATAECYADYKAKQGDPVKFHYGVMQLPDAVCGDMGAASGEVGSRLNAAGWQLLKLQSIFGSDKLNQKKADAGEFFLRF
ncbi:MAG: hypothetical protein ABI459_08030 [Deltaproteobacteria bacterium]